MSRVVREGERWPRSRLLRCAGAIAPWLAVLALIFFRNQRGDRPRTGPDPQHEYVFTE